MALATLHLVAAIPLLAGLAAGTGAVATYVAPDAPATGAVNSGATACDAQTWPYVARGCAAGGETRQVRVVVPARSNDAFGTRWAEVTTVSMEPAAAPLPPAPPGMVSSDGVLRGPQNVSAIPDQPRVKRTEARRETKRKRIETRVTSQPYRVQPYQVTAERSGETRQVDVIQPRRLDFFR